MKLDHTNAPTPEEQALAIRDFKPKIDPKASQYLEHLKKRKQGKTPLYYLPDGRGFWWDGAIR